MVTDEICRGGRKSRSGEGAIFDHFFLFLEAQPLDYWNWRSLRSVWWSFTDDRISVAIVDTGSTRLACAVYPGRPLRFPLSPR